MCFAGKDGYRNDVRILLAKHLRDNIISVEGRR